MLAELARFEGATVIVFEDVHWADESTLDLLRFLGRRIADTRGVVIATYRDDEIGPYHPLRMTLGDLATSAGVRRIAIPRLSEKAASTLIGDRPTTSARSIAAQVATLSRHRSAGHRWSWHSPDSQRRGVDPGRAPEPLRPRGSDRGRGDRKSGRTVDFARCRRFESDAVAECLAAGTLLTANEMLVFRHELAREAILSTISRPG